MCWVRESALHIIYLLVYADSILLPQCPLIKFSTHSESSQQPHDEWLKRIGWLLGITSWWWRPFAIGSTRGQLLLLFSTDTRHKNIYRFLVCGTQGQLINYTKKFPPGITITRKNREKNSVREVRSVWWIPGGKESITSHFWGKMYTQFEKRDPRSLEYKKKFVASQTTERMAAFIHCAKCLLPPSLYILVTLYFLFPFFLLFTSISFLSFPSPSCPSFARAQQRKFHPPVGRRRE